MTKRILSRVQPPMAGIGALSRLTRGSLAGALALSAVGLASLFAATVYVDLILSCWLDYPTGCL